MATEQLEKPHVDPDVLDALQEVMEDEYPLLLDTFLSDSQARLSELHEARDPLALGHAAHSFKGSSSNMGAVQLAELCRELEERARQSALAGVEDLISRIDHEFATVYKLYSDERQRFTG